jgi:hypothetical protein
MHRMIRLLRPVLCLLVPVAAGLVPGTALASVGAGVGAAPIQLERPALPGSSYTLPAVYVVNTGSEASFYVLSVERISAGPQRSVPASWLGFGTNDFSLPAGRGTYVPITLTVPARAESGLYLSDIVVATKGSAGPGALVVGARAATRLEFRVAAKSAPDDPGPSLPPWAVYLLAGAAGLAAGWGTLRWLGVKVQVERRR